jgi:YbbR domain-containing protein
VIPTEFRLSFDARATKTVDVRPRVTGAPAAGFRIVTVTSDPASVAVIGPKTRVDRIEAALTDAVDATGLRGRQTFTTTAYVDDPLVRLANNRAITVTVVAEAEKTGVAPAESAQPASAHSRH